MNSKKILAGVLTVSIVCFLMIAYTGSSSGIPPTKEELLVQSHGITVTSNKEIVYSNSNGVWQYRLNISPEGDSGILLQRLETKCYIFSKEYLPDETLGSDDFKDWWGSAYIPAGETRRFESSFSSRSPVYYRDHIFIGIDDEGNEVKGAIRVYFSNEVVEEEKPPTEEEFLDQSHGLRFERDQEIVYPDNEDRWIYALHIFPECSGWVRLERMTIKALSFQGEYTIEWVYDRDDFDQWWSSFYIPSGQKRGFMTGLSSRSPIYYLDHILTGVNEEGEEVKATCRVYFSQEKAPTP